MNAVVIDQNLEIPQRGAMAPTTPSDLLRMAVEQGADLDRLDKLMALQQRWEKDQARKAYVAAMAAFKSEPLAIVKDKHVAFRTNSGMTEYDHATIGNVTQTICAALARHGFSHRWDTKQENGQITVTCTITHELGHAESTCLTCGPDTSGGKNAIQSIASAVTYLQRYTLLAATGTATLDQEDDDGEGAGQRAESEPTPEEKAARRKKQHDEAYARHEDGIRQIKEDIAAQRWASMAVNWSEIGQEDQRALWLAPSKGGCFTTAERDAMEKNMTRGRTEKA